MSESVENRYFYLKLYRGNALAKYWLNKGEHGHNICGPDGHPAAAIYFGDINLEQIKDYSSGNNSISEYKTRVRKPKLTLRSS